MESMWKSGKLVKCSIMMSETLARSYPTVCIETLNSIISSELSKHVENYVDETNEGTVKKFC